MSDFSQHNNELSTENELPEESSSGDFFNIFGHSDDLSADSQKMNCVEQLHPSELNRYRLPVDNVSNRQGYEWVEQTFFDRKDRLGSIGLKNAREYMQFLASVDDALEKNPKQVIHDLCEIYGVETPYMQDFKYPQKVAAYQTEKDENGNYRHPYFENVRSLMADLVRKGVAEEIDDAYQKAIWLDDRVRKHMLDTYTNNELNRKAAAAQKAKQASFSPHSKSSSDSKSNKTFRQELEELFNSMN